MVRLAGRQKVLARVGGSEPLTYIQGVQGILQIPLVGGDGSVFGFIELPPQLKIARRRPRLPPSPRYVSQD